MAASWTSKTPKRLMDIVEDTGALLPDGQIIAPSRVASLATPVRERLAA